MGVELPLRVVVTILECCVTFSGVKLSIRSFVLFIIAFTETRLKPLQNIDTIQEALSEFQIVHKHQTNNYLSLAICANLSNGVSVSENEFFPQINGIYAEVVKCHMRLKVLLLYRAKYIHPLQFCNNLENIIFSHEIDLILGDLNINYFNETDSYQLRQIMVRACYTQIVKDSTFVSVVLCSYYVFASFSYMLASSSCVKSSCVSHLFFI